jgi:hypothetical protein
MWSDLNNGPRQGPMEDQIDRDYGAPVIQDMDAGGGEA